MNGSRTQSQRLQRALDHAVTTHRATYAHVLLATNNDPARMHFRANGKDEVRLYVWSRSLYGATGRASAECVSKLAVLVNGRDITPAVLALRQPSGPLTLTGEFRAGPVALDDLPPDLAPALVDWNELALVPGRRSSGWIEVVVEVNPSADAWQAGSARTGRT